MGRNDIRLRRQMMNARMLDRHRNYSVLMQQHERGIRLRRVFRVFIYFLLIAFLIVLFFIISRWQEREVQKETAQRVSTTSSFVQENSHEHF